MLHPLSRPLHIVLVEPQIPPNTGNVARLCAVTGCKLILIEPLGFSIADRDLKRAGLDYWEKVFVRCFSNYTEYLAEYSGARRFLFSARADRSFYTARFTEGCHLVFGSETHGLAPAVLETRSGALVTIPMLAQRRSLNLSTAVGIATYEALRQLGAEGGSSDQIG
jgi:tRNA (cytidine/uridine-2'-O-)-methyltransferase